MGPVLRAIRELRISLPHGYRHPGDHLHTVNLIQLIWRRLLTIVVSVVPCDERRGRIVEHSCCDEGFA